MLFEEHGGSSDWSRSREEMRSQRDKNYSLVRVGQSLAGFSKDFAFAVRRRTSGDCKKERCDLVCI